MKIILIGAGNMGQAILKGISDKNIVIALHSLHSLEKQERLRSQFPEAQYVASEGIDITDAMVILAVKPQVYPTLKCMGCAKGVISVMAGVTLATLKNTIVAQRYIRAMPNLAASLGASITALTGDETLREEAMTLLNGIGKTQWVMSEKELDIATAVAGSGPAFMMLIAEALADGAVNAGMKRGDAQVFVQGLFEGSAKLLATDHPAMIKDKVMSPGGTTAAGYAALERRGVRNALIEAIDDACTRARNLAQQGGK